MGCNNPIRPDHYRGRGDLDVIDFALAFKLDFLRGNICKYVVRSTRSRDPRLDLQKAAEYCRRLLVDLDAQAEAGAAPPIPEAMPGRDAAWVLG